MNFAIALSEEVIFRGIILKNMLRAYRRRTDGIMRAVVLGSAIFGLRHLLNLILMPDAVMMTFAQVIFTFMAGLYLSAVYIRTKNIWVCITIHFLEDFGTSIWTIFSASAKASSSAEGSIGAAIGMIALQIPYVIFAVLMLRDKEWDRKTE